MAPTKKRGAPASASQPVRRKKPATPEREAKLASYHKKQKQAIEEIKAAPQPIDKKGHPTVWTKEIEEEFERLVVLGKPVKEIGRQTDMPNEYSLWTWIADTNHPCSSAYARGKQKRVAQLEEEIEDEGNNVRTTRFVSSKQVATKDGHVLTLEEIHDFDNTERSKIRIDALKWTLAHTRPKKHGRQADGGSDKPDDQLESLFAALQSGPAKPDDSEDE